MDGYGAIQASKQVMLKAVYNTHVDHILNLIVHLGLSRGDQMSAPAGVWD